LAFAVLVAAVLILALAGKNANRSAYILIGIGAVGVSLWVLQQ
jgi:hypothetical protein